MKKVWKWILGILIVLVIVAVVVAAAFFLHRLSGAERIVQFEPYGRGGSGPGMGPGRWNHPMMGRGGGMFMGFGMLLAGLLPLGLVGLLVYGAYWLGKRKLVTAQAVTPVPTPAPAPAPTRACPKCGQFVQDGWNHCANCGKKL